ncbi:MAG: FtsX-like permease family protein [Pseudomonadota bacterium]
MNQIAISPMNRWGLWARFARRELRGGLRGFRVFVACLTLGVAAIAAVGTVTTGILEGLDEKGRALLGGDVELRLTQRELTEDERQFLEANSIDLAAMARLRGMARAERTDRRSLSEVKAVDALYPLYGELELEPTENARRPLADLLSRQDAAWGAVVDPLLARRLGVTLGDMLRIGVIDVQIRGFIKKEPDRSNEGFQLGPATIISRDALDASGLVQPGSLVRHHYRVSLSPETDLATWKSDLEKAFPNASWRVRDRNGAAPGVRRFVEQIGQFLTLVGLTALLVGGVGVGNAVRGYLDNKTRTIATFKVLGAEGADILGIYFAQIAALAVLSIIAGLLLGSLAPLGLSGALSDQIPVTPEFKFYPLALFSAALYGALITFAFTIWPLGRARDLPAARLFRAQSAPDYRRPRWLYVGLAGASIALVIIFAILFTTHKPIALGFVAAAAGTLLLLRGVAALIVWGAGRLPRLRRPSLRMAVANLHRPGNATAAIVTSLGLGLSLFATLAAVEANLSRQVAEQLPQDAPSFFFVDIQRDQISSFEGAAKAYIAEGSGPRAWVSVPSLRGPISRVNDVDASKVTPAEGYGWVLRGDRGLTFASEIPQGNIITQGDWWPADYQGEPLVSIGQGVAEGLALTVGDTLTVNILGRDITARVASLRSIDWGSWGFNFSIIFDPNTLKSAPHTFMASLSVPQDRQDDVYDQLTEAYPAITVVRMQDVFTSLASLLAQISAAVRVTAMVTIISGIFVLGGAIAAGHQARVYDAVILKILGAERIAIIRALIAEYACLGLIVGGLALLLGTGAAYVVVTEVLEIDWQLPISPMLTAVSVAFALTLGFGFVGTWRALGVRPNQYLSTTA